VASGVLSDRHVMELGATSHVHGSLERTSIHALHFTSSNIFSPQVSTSEVCDIDRAYCMLSHGLHLSTGRNGGRDDA
jgi:hypothetical protein